MTSSPRPRQTRRLLFSAIPVAALALLAAASLSSRFVSDAGPDATVLPPGTPQVVFAEFGLNEDRIYTAPADAPHDRTLRATVAHAPGWGINPGVAASGSLVAYTVLPEDTRPDRDADAELWVLDVATQNLTRLARDADLLAPPVFVEDGGALIYRRSEGAAQEVVRVQRDDLTREVIHREQTTFGIFPIAVRDGRLLFARLSAAGTDLYSVRPGDEPQHLFHASDDIARDWQISPDGTAIAFLAPRLEAERVVYRARAVSLKTLEPLIEDDAPVTVASSTATEQYGPAWTPEGELTVGQEASLEQGAPAAVLGLDGSHEVLPAPEFGFDVPIDWSADGRYLAVRWFNGRNSVEPGLEQTVIVDREGARLPIEVPSEVIFLGWYSGV